MSMYDKNHYNIVISLQLIKINEKKEKHLKNSIYVCITESVCCALETLKINYLSIKKGNYSLPRIVRHD